MDGAGNAYVTGFAYTTTGLGTAVIKYDRRGRLRWRRVLDEDRLSTGGPIALDGSGAVYVGTSAEADPGTRACRIVKLATGDGRTLWTEEWGNAYVCGPDDLVVTRAGVCHVAAGVMAGEDAPSRGWLLRVSSGGKVDASREWDPGAGISLDWRGIERLPSGDLVLLGSVGLNGDRDLVLVRAAPDCKEVWVRTWSSSGTAEDVPYDLDVDARGGIWAVGSRDPSAVGDDGSTSVVRWTSAGKRVFARRVVSGRYGTWLEGVTTDSRGNGFVVGARVLSNRRTDLVAARYSPSGRLAWRIQGLRGVGVDRLSGVCLASRAACTPAARRPLAACCSSCVDSGRRARGAGSAPSSAGTGRYSRVPLSGAIRRLSETLRIAGDTARCVAGGYPRLEDPDDHHQGAAPEPRRGRKGTAAPRRRPSRR